MKLSPSVHLQVFIDPEGQAVDTLEEFWSLCARMPQYSCSSFLTKLPSKDDIIISSSSTEHSVASPTPPPLSPPPPPPSVRSRNNLTLPLAQPQPNLSSSSSDLNLLDWLPPPVPCRSPTVPRRRSQPLPPRSLTLTPRLPRSYMPSLPSTDDLTFSRLG